MSQAATERARNECMTAGVRARRNAAKVLPSPGGCGDQGMAAGLDGRVGSARRLCYAALDALP